MLSNRVVATMVLDVMVMVMGVVWLCCECDCVMGRGSKKRREEMIAS